MGNENVKTIGEFEKQKGFLVKGANPNEKISEKEFDAIPQSDKHGVDFPKRIKFLEDNGYPVTRENLINDLSAKEKSDDN